MLTVQIYIPEINRHKRLITYGPGTLVGEMSFLDGSPRSATVLASEGAQALCLSYEEFQDLQKQQPDLASKLMKNIAKEMSQRLRTTSRFGEIE